MYKMFVNNVQVGNYKNLKEMMNSALMTYCCGKITTKMKWDGDKLFLTVF